MKTQQEMFCESHRKVYDKIHAQAFIMSVDAGHNDAKNGIKPRYPKNPDYMGAYEFEMNRIKRIHQQK